MTIEEKELRKQASDHMRRVKRWLRPLPRKANIHRYPILKIFASSARKRAYLWSFRVENAVPAIYAGCILTLMPLYGVQIPLGFALALLLRANLPILIGLQIFSNPITVLPIWFACYNIGRHFLSIFHIEALPLRRHELQIMLDNFAQADWGTNLDRMSTVFGVTSLGALIIGIFVGLILSVTYRIVAARTANSYLLIREKLHEYHVHKQQKQSHAQTDKKSESN